MAMLVEFSMWPMDKGESVGKHVARSLDIIDRSGVPYRLNPMGTVLEGEWDEVMAVVRQCFETMSQDSNRVTCTVKMDWRRGHTGRLTAKIDSVERHLGRQVRQ
ncbi:MAG: MTH1187 family thiamine-binding protein [Phycisphaerae bacterium]|nr:MTH1187 family thiamine-binding protein [Phycisphaerae bacterium]